MERVLVVVPVLGHHELTHALLGDLAREAHTADVVVVDNGGDYPSVGDEHVLRPGSNLGWAGGTNHGTLARLRPDHAGAVWLNNDTRLSAGFVAGLLECWRTTGAGVVGPSYDCYWVHQRAERVVAVDAYRPRRRHFRAPFVDGTCMFVGSDTIDAIGLLDADTFAPVGWGADIDYCLRAKATGIEIAVTRLSYLHHEKSVTARTAFDGGLDEYAERGYPVAMEGLRRKWGDGWTPVGQTEPLGRKDRFTRRSSSSRSRSSRPSRSAP
jgi:GT2 family glycosyltransferase